MKRTPVSNFLSLSLIGLLVISGCQKEDPLTPPVLLTSAVISIESTSAVCGGEITSTGGAIISEQGVCWSTTANPTISDFKKVDISGSRAFTMTITGLSAGINYHVRAYATNSIGTAYGSDIPFTTVKTIPSVTTTAISSITKSSAISGGVVTSDGGATITSKGVCWSTSANPTITDSKTLDGTGNATFASSLTGLSISTTYHVRAYASNSVGISYGSDEVFTTLSDIPSVQDNDHLLLGNPSGAITNILYAENYLMVKPQYCLSYSNSKLTTNWTSWHLYSGDIGSTPRQDDFRTDETLPSVWYHVGSGDYQYSIYGFDRGHMCPSADRTSSVENNSATFLMTNIIPQSPRNNQQTWGNLETYSRTLVDAGNELFIICGPYGQGGTSAVGTFSILGSGVVVPAKTWKIIVVLANGNNDLSRITSSTRVIAVLMPNDQSLSTDWKVFRVSVDSLESLMGYDFLSNVPANIQSIIEASVDNL